MMSALTPDNQADATFRPSPRLLQASLAGLLCLAAAGCTTKQETAAPSGPGEITSSQIIADLSAADFQGRCDERGGTVEVIPHCGGINTCKGFSYDQTTSELSEHTCAGAATCAGWNCLIPD